MDSVAFGFIGGSLILIFYGATGLYVSRHADPDDLKKVLDDGLTRKSVARVVANSFATSVKRPRFLLITGCIGLVASIVAFIVAATASGGES